MNSVVVYGTSHGNTAEIAYTIAAVLRRHGPTQVLAAEEATPARLERCDLVVVGGPAEAHQLTQPLVQFFSGVEGGVLKDKLAAAFDTRLRWPAVAGSAASGIQERLCRAGAREVMPPESFLVVGNPPKLVPGELDRAVEWAQALAVLARDRVPALAAV